ncbi:MAG: hypothetical protein MZV49_13730 [Rhodopseudomonas palustris]|nr:hypothetical protein [Rhodopseudomonas palustris]
MRNTMSAKVGVIRDSDGFAAAVLFSAMEIVATSAAQLNMAITALLVSAAAWLRREWRALPLGLSERESDAGRSHHDLTLADAQRLRGLARRGRRRAVRARRSLRCCGPAAFRTAVPDTPCNALAPRCGFALDDAFNHWIV